MKKVALCLLFLGYFISVSAQFQWVEIGISGLTCSACSRSVEMSLRKVTFIDSIHMNLENTNAKVFFKNDSIVEIEKIAQAVIDAGFSVSYLKAGFIFNNVSISNNYCFSFENNNYQFLVSDSKTLNGKIIVRFIGDKYLSKKELRPWKSKMNKACVSDKTKKKSVYYITL